MKRLRSISRLQWSSVLACLLTLPSLVVIPGRVDAQEPSEMMARVEGAQTPNRQGLDPYTLAEVMDRYHVPGVSVAVIHDFEVHWAKGYGIADVETGAMVDVETLFQAASISKPVAAMAVLEAVELDKLTLDTDINRILVSWKLPPSEWTKDAKVTPRSLLSHTSGLGDGFGFPGYEPDEPRPTTVQILDGDPPSNVGAVRMARPPLTAFHYSGGGVTVMELALVDAMGKPFPELMRELVLDPIGMVRSAYEQPLGPELDANAARAHDFQGRAREAKWHVYPELQAAGLWTTPTDLARFAIEIQKSLWGESNRVLTRESVEAMLSPVGVGDYGLGLHVEKRGEGWYFGHGGSNWGFRCRLLAHKVKGYGVAVMTNADQGSTVANEVLERVASAYGWDSLDEPVPR